MKTQIKILALFAFTLIAYSCKKGNMGNETVTDFDGNVYHTIKIGTQEWMAENLKTSHYNNGTPIPNGLSSVDWETTTSGAFAFYNNDVGNNAIYGKLYNWYAVNTNILAPKGWHIPTYAEWTVLIDFLGGTTVAGDKLKATTLWAPLAGSVNTNSSGFTALPGGWCYNTSFFYDITNKGYFLTSTGGGDNAEVIQIYDASSSYVDATYYPKYTGYSVRCVKD